MLGAVRLVVERQRDLRAEAPSAELADPRHDGLDLAGAGAGGLQGGHDQQAKEVGMALERIGRSR